MAFFAFLSWFRPWWKTAETDYETVLARLTTDIASVQTRLVRVRQRERRVSVTLTIYAIVAWIAYAAFIWLATADRRAHMAKHERFRLWAPVGVGLVVIISLRHVVRWWYRRVAAGEEKHLRSLQSTRRKKIDEIKAATRYDSLRSLLERYDDTAIRRSGSSQRVPQMPSKGSQPGQQATANSKVPSAPGKSAAAQQGQAQRQGQNVSGLQGSQIGGLVTPPPNKGNAVVQGSAPSASAGMLANGMQPTRHDKTLLDRVADKILGVDNGSQPGDAEHQYALICQVCFNHNGLCPKEDWDEVQYICPRCGTFNSRRPSSRPVSSVWGMSPVQQSHGHRHSMSNLSTTREHSPSASIHASSPRQSRMGLDEMHEEAGSASHSPSHSPASGDVTVRHARSSRQDNVDEEDEGGERYDQRDAIAGRREEDKSPDERVRQRLAEARSRTDKEEHMQID